MIDKEIVYSKLSSNSNGTLNGSYQVKRHYVGFKESDKYYLPTGKPVGKYFEKVPEAYKIYKQGRKNQLLANYISWGGVLLFFVGTGKLTNGLFSDNPATGKIITGSLVLGTGLTGFFGGFALANKGRKKVLTAIPIYNQGIEKK